MTTEDQRFATGPEHAVCPLCGADKPRKGKWYDFYPFRVVQCSACHLWYLNKRLPEKRMLNFYASKEYFRGGGKHGYLRQQGSYPDQEVCLKLTFRRFLAQLNVLGMTGGKLLEIGCGYGYLLEEARPLFDSLTGCDFDADAVQRIKRLGLCGIHGGLEALPTDVQYNTIVSTNVVEHVYDPVGFVKKLSLHLKAPGWMVFATPKMNSVWFKLLQRRWPSFKVPEHVAYYDPFTLGHLFQQCQAREMRTLSLSHAYPLGLIAWKLKLRLPGWLSRYPVWLPDTVFAVAARFDTDAN